MDEVRKDILWLREQWNPATCEPWLLAGYGASRGITRTRFDTDESYRKRVVYAYAWHKLGGKISGLEKILAESGFQAKVTNSPNSNFWAHFRVSLPLGDSFFGTDEYSYFWFLVDEFKPARSIVEILATQTTRSLPVHLGSAANNKPITQAFTWRQKQTFGSLLSFSGTGIAEITRSYAALVNRVSGSGRLGFYPLSGLTQLTKTKTGALHVAG